MRQRTSSVANVVTNTSTITTIPEAPPLPTSLSTTKSKTSWPSPTTVLNNNTVNISTSNNQIESQNNSNNEIRRRKTSSSDNKSPRKKNDFQLLQQQSVYSTNIKSTCITNYYKRSFKTFRLLYLFFVTKGDKDSTTSSTENNGHHSDLGLGPNDRNGDHDEKYSTHVSRATSKEEMNVNLTPKKHKDFLNTLSLTSEASSMPIDNEFDDLLNNRDIESLSQELENRGPQLCEKQIRYLYDIFLMADWSFLFSLIFKS